MQELTPGIKLLQLRGLFPRKDCLVLYYNRCLHLIILNNKVLGYKFFEFFFRKRINFLCGLGVNKLILGIYKLYFERICPLIDRVSYRQEEFIE